MGFDPATSAMFAASKLLPKPPQLPTPPAVQPPPQPAQAPNVQGVLANTKGIGQAGAAGLAQTFLTGAAGIDPNALKLGKPTLLGS